MFRGRNADECLRAGVQGQMPDLRRAMFGDHHIGHAARQGTQALCTQAGHDACHRALARGGTQADEQVAAR